MSSLAAPTTRGADISKGLISLLGLLALVVAVPLLLITFVGWPLPRSVPSLDEVRTALGDQYVPDRFLVGAIAVVCWLVWTELVASVVVEAIALARGRSASEVPFAAGAQKAAARLVAGVALLAALAAARGEAPAMRSLTPASAASPAAAVQLLDNAWDEAPTEEAQTAPTHTVVPRDSLWDIAESCLNDPLRWKEIWELNKGKEMPDGRTFTDPDRIHPGWVLALPADAVVPIDGNTASEGRPDQRPEAEQDRRADGADGTLAAHAGSAGDEGGPAGGGPERVEVLRPVDDDGGGDGRVEVLQPVPDSSGGTGAGAARSTVDPS